MPCKSYTFFTICVLLLLSLSQAFAQEKAESEVPDRFRLHKAAEKGDLEEVKYCVETLKMPINEEAYWDACETPLMYAAQSGNLELVKYMVAQGAEPGVSTDCDEGLESAAMYALWSKNVEMLRYFAEELNQEPESFYHSPLGYAAQGGSAEMVRYVIEKWPKASAWEDPMELAVLPRGFKLWRYEIKRSGKSDTSFSRELSHGAGNPEVVDILIEHGVPVKLRHLYWAVLAQQPEMVRSFLKALDWQWVSDIRCYNSWCRLARETGNPAVLVPFREWEEKVVQKFENLENDDELGDEGFCINPERFQPPKLSGKIVHSPYPRFAPYSGCDVETRIRLSFTRPDCSRVMISWYSPWENTAILHYGTDRKCTQTVTCDEMSRQHRVEIEIPPGQERMNYQIESFHAKGSVTKTPIFTFKTCQGCNE